MAKVIEYEKVKLLDCDLEKCVMSGPLSRETTFAIHITGPYRSVDVAKIITMLELQKSWIAEREKPRASRYEVFNDGENRWVVIDRMTDEPAPVFDTRDRAQQFIEQQTKSE